MLSAKMIPEFTDKTPAGVRAWWDSMLELGFYIHPEDDPADQVNTATGQRSLDDAACNKVSSIYAEMFELIGESESCDIGITAWYHNQGYEWNESRNEFIPIH
jgi:hypothetical protein